MKNDAVVTEIVRASFADGPGMRTVVFFKGCPLSCVWCHNPECIKQQPQVLFYEGKCIGCNMCEQGCFSGAKVLCGKIMTPKEIFSEIVLDKLNYGKDGGVTFSGGEPLIYPDTLAELISLCKAEGIRTAVETSLYIFNEEVISSLDFVMADFKIWDNDKHKKYTGVDNDVIKENFKRLDKLGIPFIVRTPIIPGINDTKEEIGLIKDFLKQFKNIQKYELLPYHPLGVSKRKALRLEPIDFEVPSKAKMEELLRYANI